MYSAEERETTCIYNYEDKTWEVYTCVPSHMTRLTKLNGDPDWIELSDDGKDRIVAAKWFGLKDKQVSFRRETKKKELTEEERKVLSDRMKKNMNG